MTELDAFLASVEGDRLAALWRVLATTGLRRGEALGLKWSDVDLQKGRVHAQRSRALNGESVLEHTPKTDRGRRSMPMPGRFDMPTTRP